VQGDILNFGKAISQISPSVTPTRMVVVADDVGVARSAGGVVGRRGIAGTVLTLKIAGALAAHPTHVASLDEVADLAELVAKNMVSVGASLAHVHVPGAKSSDEDVGKQDGVVEIGMGIHNEPGSEKLILSIEGLVKKMLAQLLDQSDKERAFLEITKEDKVVLLLNNLGGVSPLEFTAILTEVSCQLEGGWGIVPVRSLAGTFMTSLNGVGFSISLLKLVDTGLGSGLSMLELLEAPTEAVGWTAGRVETTTWNRGVAETPEDEDNDAGLEKDEVMTSNITSEHTPHFYTRMSHLC
jgi:triose/dihydroxyacetone kinase / FAD-AMP lyase (cyclizing)